MRDARKLKPGWPKKLVLGAMACSVVASPLMAAAAAPEEEASRSSRKAGPAADTGPAAIVPNGLPILDARSIQLPEDGQVLVTQRSSDQPLWAPASFGAFPPPLTEDELQKEWLRPQQSDLEADAWRMASPTRYAELTADFDGDGKPDRAVLRVGATGWKEGLFVQLSSVHPDLWQPLFSVVHDRQSPRLVMGISLARPGTYDTACGKGYGRCGPDEPRKVTLKYPGIDYFVPESAASFVFWDEKTRQLRRVWISD